MHNYITIWSIFFKVSNLTYDAFLASIIDLNEIAGHFLDSNGKQVCCKNLAKIEKKMINFFMF